MTDRERIHILSKWLYSDGQNWTDHEKAIDALFTENERLRVALHEQVANCFCPDCEMCFRHEKLLRGESHD